MIALVTVEITPDLVVSSNLTDDGETATAYDATAVYLAGASVVADKVRYTASRGDSIDGLSAWASDTAFAEAGRCYVAATHKIYQANTATTGQYPPNYTGGSNPVWTEVGTVNCGVAVSDTTYWSKSGAINSWAMFDAFTDTSSVGVAVEGGYEILVELDASKCNGVAFYGLDGDTIELTVLTDEETLWTSTTELVQRKSLSYSDYFFGRNIKIIKALCKQFPAYFETRLRIRIFGTETAKCGMVDLGYFKEVGTSEDTLTLSTLGYGTIDTNSFGYTTITPGMTKRKRTVPLHFPIEQLDDISDFFDNEIPYKACTFLCDGLDGRRSLMVHGIPENLTISANGEICKATVDIRGIN